MAGKEKSRNADRLTPDVVGIPPTDISVYDAFYRRRMAWRFKDTPVDREAVNRMLDNAV